MAKIKRLSKDVISQIAAGEVVERPMAAIKEMVENSIDAGAKAVSVEIKGGGIDSIRVSDNGSGIAEEDLVLVFERHATSKLSTAEELTHINTLGFRGEALSSIAAVGKVTLSTRQEKMELGVEVKNHGGEILGINPKAMAFGTTILVEDLFFNAPVRRKFLKRPQSEAALVSDLMRQMILSHPEIAFSFKSDGKLIYRSSGDGKIQSAFLSVYGLAALRETKEVKFTGQGIIVEGLVGVGQLSRGNRSHENFFINNRAINSGILSQAVEEASRQRVMIGRYPTCALYLQMPFHQVDVNVHPNKWEVRFANEKAVLETVRQAVEEALNEGAAEQVPPSFFPPEEVKKAEAPVRVMPPVEAKPALEVEKPKPILVETPAPKPQIPIEKLQTTLFVSDPAKSSAPVMDKAVLPTLDTIKKEAGQKASAIEITPALAEKPIKFLGVAFQTYILFESGENLILCDQHALHERILYDKLMAAHEQGAAAQMLLIPRAVDLSLKEYDLFLENQALLSSFGFDAEDFGNRSVRLHSVPIILGEPEAESAFKDALDELETSGSLSHEKKESKIIQSACKHAIKGGEKRSMDDVRALVLKMLNDNIIPTCPHGRPLMLKITRRELEKRFGRLGS